MTDNAIIKRPGVRFVHELEPGDQVLVMFDRIVVVNPNRPPLIIDGDKKTELRPRELHP